MSEAASPEFSILIPAYNEEEELARTLPALRAAAEATGRAFEIVVADNNSTDRTAEVARAHGARVAFEPVNQISRARNAAAAAAQGRYLLFVDADTLVPAELFRAALAHLDSGACAGGGARFMLDDAKLGRRVRALLGAWNWLSVHCRVAAGGFIWCTREAFEGAGGFSRRVYAAEDVLFSRAVKRWARRRGLEFRILTEAPILTSARKVRHLSWPRIYLMFALLTLCPLLLMSRRFCRFWYRRP